LTLDRNGFPGAKITCADNQAFCDADASANGACTFRIAVCLNSADPRVACSPSAVSAVQLSSRLANSTDATDQANVAALLDALKGIDPGSTGTVAGGGVSYSPPASTGNACSGYVDLVVPVGSSGSTSGTRVLGLTAETAAGPVRQTLKLVCLPSFP
jgi:hypothetical protein